MRPVVRHADEAMMVGHDSRHNRQAESGAAFFARKVGLENARAEARVDSGAIVGDFEGDDRVVGKPGMRTSICGRSPL